LEQFRLLGDVQGFPSLAAELAATPRDAESPLLGFLRTSTESALAASGRLAAQAGEYRSTIEYPESSLAEKLRLVAQLLEADMGARIFYVEMDGFDTHARQADAHAALLRQLGDAASAFLRDVAARGQGDRVLLTAFSEFGRRVEENASAGTDHGAAAPMFVAGQAVRSGLIGPHPSLTDLDDGDLKHHTDFRQIYATILENWLHCPSAAILDGRFETLEELIV
jgi:uncharacterized protein (DUF1501 family)